MPGGARRLIVNADDYGLTEGVSRGILRAYRHGIVSSTSVLAVGPALAHTGPWLADVPGLGVGVHLAAVGEDPPLLSAREIPSLVDRRGRLPRSWRTFLLRAAAGRVDPDDLAREFSAQVARVAALGRPLTHLDSHQHVHLWPSVREVVLGVGRRHGIPALRVPRSRGGRLAGLGVSWLARELARRATAAGLAFPATAAGFDEAGQLDLPALRQVLDRLAATPAPTAELGVHPGEADDPARARYPWGYAWERELAALTDPAARAAVAACGFRLATYADLTGG